MADPLALLSKHRSRGVVLDANLLVLYFIGRVNPRRISKFKRTQRYTPTDFVLLTKLLDWFGHLAATPHVLSQSSDLATPAGREPLLVRTHFRELAEQIEERYDTSRELTRHAVFERFGLADSAIASAADRGVLVLTDDLDLQIAIELRRGDALNFNQLRDIRWEGGKALWQEAKQ